MTVSRPIGAHDDLFLRAAAALWGGNWQAQASRNLGISERQIRRMVSGEARVPPGLYVDIMRLMAEHQLVLDKLLDELKQRGAA